jgi:hypothetical protein
MTNPNRLATFLKTLQDQPALAAMMVRGSSVPLDFMHSSLRFAVAASALVAAADRVAACTVCTWGDTPVHPVGGSEQVIADRIAHFNENLKHGGMPLIEGETFGDIDRSIGRLGPGNTTQQVWVDFSQAANGVFNSSERAAIVAGLEDVYTGFDISFSQSVPSGNFTRLSYDSQGLGGIAITGIDFRNTAANDVGLIGTNGLQSEPSANQINYSINVGAHELGHTFGLRHHDSFGPIGNGVPNTAGGPFGQPIADIFQPDFDGPRAGFDFFENTMSTPALGGSFNFFFDGRTALSERSLIKLQYAAQGTIDSEAGDAGSSVGSAQNLTLEFLDVLNTRPAGTSVGDSGLPYLPSRAGAVSGAISSFSDRDTFAIEAFAGDFLSVEAISTSINQRIFNTVNTVIRVVDAFGNELDYYGQGADNDEELETSDSWILDLIVPEDGTYFVQVDGFSSSTGFYELFVSSYGTGRIAGDANGDGTVDLADFTILRNNFGSAARFSTGDFTGDLLVDLADFTVLRNNFGNSADLDVLDAWHATVVPEPTTAALAGLGGLTLLRRRR